MIIEPDFLDHWKTQLLVGLTQHEPSPLWVIRLWAHCQMRRQSKFENLSAAALKAICRAQLDAEIVESALTEAGFIERRASRLIVRGWDEYNGKLVANWNNGKRGGRNPRRTQTEIGVTQNQVGVTHSEPIREEKRREEKIREEKKCARPASVEEVSQYCLERANSVDPQAWWDHYEANGWKVGRNPMRDWKASVRTWEKNGIKSVSDGKTKSRRVMSVEEANATWNPNGP